MPNDAQRIPLRWIAAAILAMLGWVPALASPVIVQPLVGQAQDALYRDAVLASLSGAQSTIDVLLSSVSMDGNPLLPALVAATERGVDVRVLLDASSWAPDITARNLSAMTYLVDRGVDARFDDPEVTLHAKLVIVDSQIVILGSSNWNRYAFTEHRQADVLIVDSAIAGFYRAYFDLPWHQPPLTHRIEVDPAPEGRAVIIPLADLPDTVSYADTVLGLLQRAQASVHIAMYRASYYPGYGDSSSNQLMDAVADAAGRGLDVKLLIDDCAGFEDSAQANLAAALRLALLGVEVRFDPPEVTTHAKLIIIDGHCVILGSTNWNYYALEKNYEIAVVFLHLPDVAEPFERYFLTLWETGREIGF